MFRILGPAPRAGGPIVVVAVAEEAHAFANQFPTLVTGVGKVRAATATAWACVEHRPGMLLNVGTAGALRPAEVHRGVVYEVGIVIQHDLDGAAIEAFTGVDPAPRLRLADTGIVLATGDRFISSPHARDALAQAAHLVDMEGYSVAAAAQWLDVPVRVAKAVSDDAGQDAATSWSESLAGASRLLGAWLEAALD